MAVPTPGAPNGPAVAELTPAPEFSVAHGYYRKAIVLEIVSPTAGSTVLYTTDGSVPTRLNGQVYREPIVVQAYLPAVRDGDSRIILIDGKAAGVVKRVPKQGEARANLHVGARAEKATLSKRDLEICEAIGPELSRRGLIFVGIDVIGGYLTEINVTSPTGIQEIGRFNGVSLESDLWDAFEARFSASRG